MEKGFTIQVLAKKVGVSGYTLGKKISNKSPMDLDEADEIAKELDIQDEEYAIYFFTH